MPRSLGVLLIAAASLLFGVYAWFGVVWLLSTAAKVTDAPFLEFVMLILAPHVAGWLVALAFSVIAFVLGLWLARTCRIAWLGFGANPPVKQSLADEAAPPPR